MAKDATRPRFEVRGWPHHTNSAGLTKFTVMTPNGGRKKKKPAEQPVPQSISHAERPSCEICLRLKKKCLYESKDGPCARCARLSKDCIPQDTSISRRKKERLRKAERWREARAASASTPVFAAAASGFSGPSTATDSVSARIGSGSDLSAPSESGKSSNNLDSPLSLVVASAEDEEASTLATELTLTSRATASIPADVAVPTSAASSSLGAFTIGTAPVFSEIANILFAAPSLPVSSTGPGLTETKPGYLPQALFFLPRPMATLEDVRLDLIQPCLYLFWEEFQPICSFLHRPTFEGAFSGTPSPIYGINKPSALLFALAATGIRHFRGNNLTETDKLRIAKAYCDRAKDLLLSGYSSNIAHAPPMTDMEAAQTVAILLQVLLAVGQASSAFHLVRHGGVVLMRLACQPVRREETGGDSPLSARTSPANWLISSQEDPINAVEWIRQELVVRLWIGFASMDVPFAYYSQRDPVCDFFAGVFRLPCHDAFFDHPDPEHAFALLYGRMPGFVRGPEPAFVDFGVFFANPSLATGRQVVRELMEPVFTQRGSTMNGLHLLHFFRYMRLQLRRFATMSAIDTLAMISKSAEEYSPTERVYKDRITLFDALIAYAFEVLPPHIGEPILRGDPGPFFMESYRYFARSSHAHILLNCLQIFRTFSMEHYLQGDPTSGDAHLLSSPEFLPILESGITFVKLMQGQFAADPGLRWCHFITSTAALKIAAINLASINMIRGDGGGDEEEIKQKVDLSPFAHDLRVILRHLETVGAKYGLLTRKVADNLKAAIVAAGVTPHATPFVELNPIGEDAEIVAPTKVTATFMTVPNGSANAQVNGAETVDTDDKSFADMFLTADRVLKSWVA